MKQTTVVKPECQKEAEDVYFLQHVCHSDVCPVLSGRARSCCHTVRKRKITFCQLSQPPGLLILCFQAIRAMSSTYLTLQPAGLTYLHLDDFFFFFKKNIERALLNYRLKRSKAKQTHSMAQLASPFGLQYLGNTVVKRCPMSPSSTIQGSKSQEATCIETHQCWGASADGRYEPRAQASGGLRREKSMLRSLIV